MASPNNPPSSAELIRTHSRARVIYPSRKPLIVGAHPITGMPMLARELTDADVRESMVRQYR